MPLEKEEKEYVTRSEFGRLVEMVEENTQATNRVEKNTEGVVAMFEAASGAFKVLELIGKLGKPLIYLGGLVTLIATGIANFKGVK
jgi:hypothetical protein